MLMSELFTYVLVIHTFNFHVLQFFLELFIRFHIMYIDVLVNHTFNFHVLQCFLNTLFVIILHSLIYMYDCRVTLLNFNVSMMS